ncbi:hypothetical protein PRIPAC_72126 [Pristionchus pacificus]|uniref:Uncharacterized protein n=1 Tax=Pristionchus pacificus TaxID=54126 RepID=A0A2A6CZI8_PRIPA|nr:hypothetical protein PRIPAC_72126 [Pristionchus pacificus]|eukprot:PDM83644.1 hypothetical protein PRIPAC_30131 [Pristionchus pacificus]
MRKSDDDRYSSQANAILYDALHDMLQKSDSYKFLRMSDDMHEVAQYLNDIRICFIVITVTGYIFIFIYLIMLCVRRNRRNAPRRRNWDGYQVGKVGDGNFSAATSNNEEQLTSVRTETVAPYMRNHHSRLGADRNPPSFMRHGHLNHQQTTRLISEQDGSVVKHQIPHITTDPPPPSEKNLASVPQLVKDSAAQDISVS